MEEADKEKTVFTSPLGLLQFTVNLSMIGGPSAQGDRGVRRSLHR